MSLNHAATQQQWAHLQCGSIKPPTLHCCCPVSLHSSTSISNAAKIPGCPTPLSHISQYAGNDLTPNSLKRSNYKCHIGGQPEDLIWFGSKHHSFYFNFTATHSYRNKKANVKGNAMMEPVLVYSSCSAQC